MAAALEGGVTVLDLGSGQVAVVDHTAGQGLVGYVMEADGSLGASLSVAVPEMQAGATGAFTASAAGNDRLLGGSNADTLEGEAGNDTLIGAAKGDTLIGAAKGDTLLGGAGDDLLNGGTGFDRLEGGTGADVLLGGSNADTLLGGAGDDTLEAGRGLDVLTGGAGADVFVFHDGDDINRIRDFTPGSDLLHLDLTEQSFAALTVTPTGPNLRVDWTDGSVILEGVAPGELDASDVIFTRNARDRGCRARPRGEGAWPEAALCWSGSHAGSCAPTRQRLPGPDAP